MRAYDVGLVLILPRYLWNPNCDFYVLGNSVHPRYAPFFQAFDPEELADITLDTIVFYVKGRVEGVPLSGVSGAVGSALNTKYIVKHRVQSGMLDKVTSRSIKIQWTL